ncbi:lipocalin family protein [uncultured Aquimarina sp.]|uniref:lipocalin family protein n=1 Tax=uncultured Aquimarina sp. TaxID=575652 RepID=UPI0026379510|nr:lipocalin family protein [uncultured Aquimarina sp.]
MKKYMFLFLIPLLFVFSCSSDDDTIVNPDLLGKWRLIEQLVDPGDGSGRFEPINSDLELEFFAAGVLQVSNGTLCSLNIDSEGSSTESYSIDENVINVDCDNAIGISFEIKEGSLFLYFACIEGCGQKYQKLP